MRHYNEMLDKVISKDDVTPANQPPAPDTPVFLVLERDPLIAEDIVGSLKDIGPCETIRVSEVGELAQRLNTDRRISAAFLEMRYAQVVESGLDRHLADHGSRIILTIGEDDQQEALARGWGMLLRPFTDQMIRDAVVGGDHG